MNIQSVKQQFGNELRSGWPLKLASTSLVSSGLFIGCLWLLVGLTTKNCGTGFDGLGCAIGGALISEVAAVLLLLITGTIMIHSLVLKTWSATFFSMIPAAVFVVMLNLSGGLDGLAPGFITGKIASAVWVTVMMAIALSAVLLFDLWLFQYVRTQRWWVRVFVCLLLVCGFCAGVPYVFGFIQEQYYNAQQRHQISSLSYSLYTPTYTLNGYHALSSNLSLKSAYQAQYYEIDYIYGTNELNDPTPYEVYQSEAPSSYTPPSNCGQATPSIGGVGYYLQDCELIGHSVAGCDVYYSAPESTNDITGYCKLGGTLITIQTTVGEPGKYLQKSDMLKIFNSLQPATASQLQKLST